MKPRFPRRVPGSVAPGAALAVILLLSALSLPDRVLGAREAPEDPRLWLEEVTGKEALDWVKARNAESTRELAESESFRALNDRFLAILDSDARIPAVSKMGDHYYNFWRDRKNPRGLWRRTSLAEYRKEQPAWEIVIDLDALAQAEGENWVWRGVNALPPDYARCLVSLSRGGADATVVREFDLTTQSFVPDGFALPESKSRVAWIDRDRLFVGPAMDSATMTTSGYPRVVVEWRRGTPLASAAPVFEGRREDVWVYAFRDHNPGFEREFVVRGITFFSDEVYLRRDGQLVRIEKPDGAEADVHREWLLLKLRSDWSVAGKTWPAGALLACRLEDFLGGKREFDVLFQPTERTSLAGFSRTRNAILLNELDNVKNRLYALRHDGTRWERSTLPGLPEFGTLSASAVDRHGSDDYFLTVTDFLTPNSLSLGTVGGAAAEKLKQTPSFFDTAGLVVSQHEAVSKDGTRIPYFQVARRDLRIDGTAPALLTGYGGFELPQLPSYNAVRGSGWLERGGVLAVANIRGGGEFGPKWHQAALKANRPRAYQDFIAVAEDLVRRRVTSPRRLACMGGSNGGLLVGNMLTMRPDLFGAVVCQVPLLDMQRYHKLLAGASWMEEYGNPDDPAERAFLRTFSPYHNLKRGVRYPRTLFTTSTRDDRVHPGHARKTAALMREQGHDVLYYENVEGGHGGAANNKQQAFMSALAYTFLWKQLGGGGLAPSAAAPR